MLLDYAIRVSLEPCNPRYLRMIFHPRAVRDGHQSERHPAIEQALERMPRPPRFESEEVPA